MRCESDRTPPSRPTPVPLIECVKTPTGAGLDRARPARVSTEPDQRPEWHVQSCPSRTPRGCCPCYPQPDGGRAPCRRAAPSGRTRSSSPSESGGLGGTPHRDPSVMRWSCLGRHSEPSVGCGQVALAGGRWTVRGCSPGRGGGHPTFRRKPTPTDHDGPKESAGRHRERSLFGARIA